MNRREFIGTGGSLAWGAVASLAASGKSPKRVLLSKQGCGRATGYAEANKIIGDSLKDNPRYLQYLYITGLQEGSEKGNRTIYVPTEGGLPVPTLGIEK